MVEWLIDGCAANPSQPTTHGTSPLLKALINGRTETVLSLIDRAAVTNPIQLKHNTLLS